MESAEPSKTSKIITSAPTDQDDDEDVSDDDEEAMNHEPTQEEIEAALKYKMTKQAEAEKIKSYNERV